MLTEEVQPIDNLENNPILLVDNLQSSIPSQSISKNKTFAILGIVVILLIALLVLLLSFLFSQSSGGVEKKQFTPESTNSQVEEIQVLSPESPHNVLVDDLGKYSIDTDQDSIPNFVEDAISYNSQEDECLVEACSGISVVKTHVVFILDSSGSMAEVVGTTTKMDTAKAALNKLIGNLPEGVSADLIVYGHKGSNSKQDKSLSCDGIEVVYSSEANNPSDFRQILDQVRPTGWTPIADSLTKSQQLFVDNPNDNNIVVLVTDGLETCDGSPESALKELRGSSSNPTVHLIGFGVNSADSKILEKLSTFGGGQYYLASKAEELNFVFDDIKRALETLQCNQASANTYISCVTKRADASSQYLNKINQSLYQNNQPYEGVSASSEDSHEAISSTQANISRHKIGAGSKFTELLINASEFIGQNLKK